MGLYLMPNRCPDLLLDLPREQRGTLEDDFLKDGRRFGPAMRVTQLLYVRRLVVADVLLRSARDPFTIMFCERTTRDGT